MDIKEFIRERNDALFSLDEGKILAYAKKYGIDMPEDKTVFWAGIHKAICGITDAPDELKEKSKMWLREHGFRTEIAGVDQHDMP